MRALNLCDRLSRLIAVKPVHADLRPVARDLDADRPRIDVAGVPGLFCEGDHLRRLAAVLAQDDMRADLGAELGEPTDRAAIRALAIMRDDEIDRRSAARG